MNVDSFNQGLLEFLQASPSPFHAVSSLSEILEAAGFIKLDEGDEWNLQLSGSYFITRNDSSIVAFRTGSGDLINAGLKMAGAHTDSPCLKIKPQPEILKKGFAQLGVEVYGGALLNPWFDRDLSIAGRVNYKGKEGQLLSCLVDFKKAVATIPSLAIHLDREANNSRSINAQNDLPVLLLQSEKAIEFKSILEDQLKAQKIELTEIMDFELCLYDVQPPSVTGLNQDFIASARLDNLLSCYVGVQALLDAPKDQAGLLVCNDHEEVGSSSAAGAQGPFLESVLERMCEQLCEKQSVSRKSETFRRMIDKSMMVSMDNAHGIHPNFADKHDQQHGPILNKGPVIKINANQRYATSSETSSIFRLAAEEINEPVQAFVVRSDMGCGSTIGPIVASELGVKTIDVGVPTFAMHSIRELAGSKDAYSLFNIMKSFFTSK